MKTRFPIFAALALLTISLFLVPAWILQPFRYQSLSALRLALALRTHAPTLTLILTGITAIFGGMMWHSARWWQRIAIVAGVFLVFASTFLARTNYFEWMFHPFTSAQFAPADKTGLASSDMVMALRINGQSRAYPIREMAYHHVLNDTVGGVPIAVTY